MKSNQSRNLTMAITFREYQVVKKSILFTVLMAMLLVVTQAVNAYEERNGLIFKAGSYSPSDNDQTVAGLPITFDDSADTVLGLEYEFRFSEEVGFGVELLAFSAPYKENFFSTPGEADVVMLMANVRRYFYVAENFRPYFGAGLGAVGVSMSGPINGSAGGLGFQGMIGAEIPFERVGLVLEYKYVAAEAEDDYDQKVDVSGSGFFAGLVMRF
jgi:opacity protein-like surface antigen